MSLYNKKYIVLYIINVNMSSKSSEYNCSLLPLRDGCEKHYSELNNGKQLMNNNVLMDEVHHLLHNC